MGKIRPQTPGEVFGRRVREERDKQRLTQQDVVDRLTKLGHPMDRSNLGRIERGETTGQLDNLMALALALGVAPIHLMLPQNGEEEVAIAPRRRLAAEEARQWIGGRRMLDDSNPLTFFLAMSESEQSAVAARGSAHISPLALALAAPRIAEDMREAIRDVLEESARERKSKSRRRIRKEGSDG